MPQTDDCRTELVWPGKYNSDGTPATIPPMTLPFQVIERVSESRATREASKAPRTLSLFEIYEGKEGRTFDEGWRNKLIWGDNLLVMNSLMEHFSGKIDLIYIDPPFATGADFSFTTLIGDSPVEYNRAQSMLEETAYRDTWNRYGPGRELDSYLQMMFPRLKLIRELLSDKGTAFIHVDYRASSALRFALDEVFGQQQFLGEIIWHYRRWPTPAREYQKMHDNILCYARRKGEHIFNVQYGARSESTQRRWQDRSIVASHGDGGQRIPSNYGDSQSLGAPLDDVWDIPIIAPVAHERTGFATQKPLALLERIILGSSVENSIVADFFCGSGTTLEAAERCGRRWIGCDLGRWGIHVSRKRMLGLDPCRPFEILNLGKYERQYWQSASFSGRQNKELLLYEYLSFVLKLYGASPLAGMIYVHGKKGHAAVHIGSIDAPVTIEEILLTLDECLKVKVTELHVLGWDWEMGLHDLMVNEAASMGVKLLLLQIPREVMDQQAARSGDVRFFELAYVEAAPHSIGPRSIIIELQNFVMPNAELLPDSVKAKVSKWSDYVDYWAVDWDFRDDTFMQGWVAYRTRESRRLELRSDAHTYDQPGTHTALIKVIDIFGNDTTQAISVEVG